jgi:hypothetical protein
MSKDVWVVEDFYWNTSFGLNDFGEPDMRKDSTMPKVWFGKGAEVNARAYLEEFARINNWTECKCDWNKQKAFRGRDLGEGDEKWFSAKQLCLLINDYCVNIKV